MVTIIIRWIHDYEQTKSFSPHQSVTRENSFSWCKNYQPERSGVRSRKPYIKHIYLHIYLSAGFAQMCSEGRKTGKVGNLTGFNIMKSTTYTFSSLIFFICGNSVVWLQQFYTFLRLCHNSSATKDSFEYFLPKMCVPKIKRESPHSNYNQQCQLSTSILHLLVLIMLDCHEMNCIY